MVIWKASRTLRRSQCLLACLCRNRKSKMLETCGYGPGPIGLMQLYFESVVQKRSSNSRDTRRLNCQSLVRSWVDQAMFYWRTTCLGTISAAIMRVRRSDGLCTFVYEGWATSTVGGNVCVMNCLSLIPSALLSPRRRHDRLKRLLNSIRLYFKTHGEFILQLIPFVSLNWRPSL